MAGITGAGGLLLQPRGGSIAVGAVTGDGDVLASGAGGSVSLASLSGNGALTVNFDAGSFGQMTVSGALAGQRDIDVRAGTLVLGTVVPLAFTGQITPIGFGMLSESQLLERIAIVSSPEGVAMLPSATRQIDLR